MGWPRGTTACQRPFVDEDIWCNVVGQPSAVALLSAAAQDPVHAYLFVGPPGCTKFEAARVFAALVIDPSGDAVGTRRPSRPHR